MKLLIAASRPTMYFIGVTTSQSSIMKVFPKWAAFLGFPEAQMKGIDIPIHAEPALYREVVQFIKNDPLSLGALVTTHKIDLYQAAKDLFDYLDPYALAFGELSSISKKDGLLYGHAKDPITCGMAMDEFIPLDYWKNHPKAGVFVMGAGGSAISICSYYMRNGGNGNSPAKIVVSNRSRPRLDAIREINARMNMHQIPEEYDLCPNTQDNDRVLETMGEGSLIINATGLGKDRPGSPLSEACNFPKEAIVWELNYRGERRFMHQALEQSRQKNLYVHDGWMYFIYGWTQVIAEVFHTEILGERLQNLSRIARDSQTAPSPKNHDAFPEKPDFLRGCSIPFDPITGLCDQVETTKRYLSQMKGMYHDTEAFEQLLLAGDRVLYEFHELALPPTDGNLAFGFSILYPGKVGDEYYFTKGHFHEILETGEVYFCTAGRGYMLLESPEGDWSLQEMSPGRAVYVPPRYAHRSINISPDEKLISFFVFRADAGHDYGTIEEKGYRKLVVEKDGQAEVVDNPSWN